MENGVSTSFLHTRTGDLSIYFPSGIVQFDIQQIVLKNVAFGYTVVNQKGRHVTRG